MEANFQSKAASTLLRIAALSTAALAVVSIYTFYLNELWKPSVDVKSVDFSTGLANLSIGGKEFVLRGGSEYLIRGVWGIRFGISLNPNGVSKYDRIEITKNGKVVKVIRQS